MKRVLFILVILFFASPAWATYWVDQSGASGADGSSYANRASVATFNAKSDWTTGETVVLCGAVTSEVNPDTSFDGNDLDLRCQSVHGEGTDAVIDRSDGGCALDFTNISAFNIYGGTVQECGVSNCTDTSIPACIYVGGEENISGWSISGLTVEENPQGQRGIYVGIAAGYSNSDWDIQNCTLDGMDTDEPGMTVVVATEGGTITNGRIHGNIFEGSASAGIDALQITNGSNSDNINYIYFYNNVVKNFTENSVENCIDIKNGPDYIYIYNNEFYNVDGDCIIAHNIGAWSTIHDLWIYNNRIHGMGGGGINLKGKALDVTDVYIIGNLIYDNDADGIMAYRQDTADIHNLYIYGNTIVNNATGCLTNDSGIQLHDLGGDANSTKIKNNILSNNRSGCGSQQYIQIYVHSGQESYIESDYNTGFYSGTSAQVYWGASGEVNFAGHDSGSYNLDRDPDFTLAPGVTYTLNSTSSEIDAAVALGAPYDQLLDPSDTDWTTEPPKVQLMSANERGAYGFEDSPPQGGDTGLYIVLGGTKTLTLSGE